jgi:hypothetical protein
MATPKTEFKKWDKVICIDNCENDFLKEHLTLGAEYVIKKVEIYDKNSTEKNEGVYLIFFGLEHLSCYLWRFRLSENKTTEVEKILYE